VTLRRMDTGAEHRVSVGLDGRWRCTCKDKEFDKRTHRSRPRGGDCKHLEATRPLWALVEKLTVKGEAKA
jgi:hypothetical protein